MSTQPTLWFGLGKRDTSRVSQPTITTLALSAAVGWPGCQSHRAGLAFVKLCWDVVMGFWSFFFFFYFFFRSAALRALPQKTKTNRKTARVGKRGSTLHPGLAREAGYLSSRVGGLHVIHGRRRRG